MRTTAAQIEQRRFEQAIANRHWYQVERLGTAFARVLQSGGGAPLQREVLERVWRAVAPEPAWPATRVEALDGGVLQIAVADPVTRYHLLGQRGRLLERLRHSLPRLRALRFGLDENGFGT